MHTSSRKAWLTVAVAAMSAVAVGCAITDYAGWASRKTASEAALWGSDIAFFNTGPGGQPGPLDGTYNYTVQYNCRGAPTTFLGACGGAFTQPTAIITTYFNPVVGAFSWFGWVDRDGDNIQGTRGSLTPPPFTPAGKFQPAWVSADDLAGCQFYGIPGFGPPLKQNFIKQDPQIGLCFTFPWEEVDANQDLQEPFNNLGDLAAQVWSGALGTNFTLQLTQLIVNGTPVTLNNALNIGVVQNGFRPGAASIDLGSPGGQDLIRALVTNAPSGQPVSLVATFAGGMTIATPVHMAVAINRDALAKLLH